MPKWSYWLIGVGALLVVGGLCWVAIEFCYRLLLKGKRQRQESGVNLIQVKDIREHTTSNGDLNHIKYNLIIFP